MKRIVACAAVVGLSAFGLAACNDVHSVRDDTASSAPKTTTASHKPKPAEPLVPGAYSDGTKVDVSNLSRFVSSDYASPSDANAVKFTVTVTNDSDAPIDNSMVDVECIANGKTAESVADDNVDFVGVGHTLPGQSYSFTYACELPLSVSTVQVEVTPYNGDNLDASVFIESVS